MPDSMDRPASIALALLLTLGLGACANLNEPPERKPAAVTVTQPADEPPDESKADAESQAEEICRQSDRDAELVESYESKRRGSHVSTFNCVKG